MNGTMVLTQSNNAVRSKAMAYSRDNNLSNYLTLDLYLQMRYNEYVFKCRNKFTPQLFDLLNVVVKMFSSGRKPLNSYVIAKVMQPEDYGSNAVMGVKHKLDRLVKKGYAERIGTQGKSILYIPTERAYKELSELIK